VYHPPVVEVPPAPPLYHPPVVEVPPASPVFHTLAAEIKLPEEPKPPVFFEQREELIPPVPYIEQLGHKEEPKTESTAKGESRFYSPLVKNIAAQENISNAELDLIPGTGAEGRLTKDDLLNYIQNRYLSASQSQHIPAEQEPAKITHEPVTEAPGAAITEMPAPELFEEQVITTVIEAPEPVIELPEPEPVFERLQPEPVFEQPKPEPVVEKAPPEPIVEQPKPEPVAEQPKPEPISAPAVESTIKTSTSMSGGDEIIEMDRMRRLIADHMVMSKHTSPHVTSFVEADVTNLVLWRDKIKGNFEKREGEKITFTPLFIEAVVRSIKDMPMINVQVNGTQIIKKKDINISMATALPSGNLIVPVIKRADELSLIGLTKAVNDLANRARTGKLKPDDIQDGTFTITNVGSFGNVMGTPIINQPQVAILAVGAIRKKPAVIETLQGDMIGIRHMMFLSLSYDHRVVDGALGGSFVRRVADYLENWDPGREI
jgi:2-oxoglutarate dehydrogenase E2 component (dihydrolipoamide succinyltransferase)